MKMKSIRLDFPAHLAAERPDEQIKAALAAALQAVPNPLPLHTAFLNAALSASVDQYDDRYGAVRTRCCGSVGW